MLRLINDGSVADRLSIACEPSTPHHYCKLQLWLFNADVLLKKEGMRASVFGSRRSARARRAL